MCISRAYWMQEWQHLSCEFCWETKPTAAYWFEFWNESEKPLIQFDLISDTSYGLFGGAASLVCNRLMATWKTDLSIALSAMEVLSGLAKVHLNTPNHLMCKRTVLHSMIVAAFQCLTLWLVEHHYLLQDKECLHYVLEVVELGISGSKSQVRLFKCFLLYSFGIVDHRYWNKNF
jgi:hypothetical protein